MRIRCNIVALLAGLPLALSAAGDSSILVSASWLAQHLNDPSLVILHAGSQKDYDEAHIPGARLVTLGEISITDARGLRLELPPPGALAGAFGRLGVGNESRVVVYAGTDSVQTATRVWFTLDYLGLGDRTALLDGGLGFWRSEGRPLSTEAPPIRPRKLTAHPAPQVVVAADWIRAHLGDPTVQLLDARLPQFYSGASAGGMPRAGHIPGARSVPFNSAFTPQGTFKPEATLRAILTAGGNREPALTVSYCHIGQQATVLYFVARYLGMNARLYDGSFQDWSMRAEMPVAK